MELNAPPPGVHRKPTPPGCSKKNTPPPRPPPPKPQSSAPPRIRPNVPQRPISNRAHSDPFPLRPMPSPPASANSGRDLYVSAMDDTTSILEEFFSPSLKSNGDDSNNPFAALERQSPSSTTIAPTVISRPPPPPRAKQTYRILLWDYSPAHTVANALTVRAGDRVLVQSIQDDWSTCVSAFGERGLVPSAYLATLPQIAELAPPPFIGMEAGTRSGYARDLIAVRSHDLTRAPVTKCTARFYGASAKIEHINDRVVMLVDGKQVATLRMGQCGVPVGGDSLDLSTLAPHALRDLTVQSLNVRYEHVSIRGLSYCECTMYVWNAGDDCTVSDIDGTITRSDLAGHFNTTIRQKAGFKANHYAHNGVCALFTYLQGNLQSRFLYLTARPLNLCQETQDFLLGLEQNGKTLPRGPCITDDSTLYQSIFKEVGGVADRFKSEFLIRDLKPCFDRAREGSKYKTLPMFLAGFGNKMTDAVAYSKACVHPALTFVIDSNSQIAIDVAGKFAKTLDSYHDPVLEKWIAEKSYQLRERGQVSSASITS